MRALHCQDPDAASTASWFSQLNPPPPGLRTNRQSNLSKRDQNLRVSGTCRDGAGPATQNSQPLPPKPTQAAAAPEVPTDSQRWSVKRAPGTEADLVVAKKKVAQVREWLEATREAPVGGGHLQRVLLLTGAQSPCSSHTTAEPDRSKAELPGRAQTELR